MMAHHPRWNMMADLWTSTTSLRNIRLLVLHINENTDVMMPRTLLSMKDKDGVSWSFADRIVPATVIRMVTDWKYPQGSKRNRLAATVTKTGTLKRMTAASPMCKSSKDTMLRNMFVVANMLLKKTRTNRLLGSRTGWPDLIMSGMDRENMPRKR